jgi:hypothetical protein
MMKFNWIVLQHMGYKNYSPNEKCKSVKMDRVKKWNMAIIVNTDYDNMSTYMHEHI